jgi:hypothetical protein
VYPDLEHAVSHAPWRQKPFADGDSDRFFELRLIDPASHQRSIALERDMATSLLETDANMSLAINSGFD